MSAFDNFIVLGIALSIGCVGMMLLVLITFIVSKTMREEIKHDWNGG